MAGNQVGAFAASGETYTVYARMFHNSIFFEDALSDRVSEFLDNVVDAMCDFLGELAHVYRKLGYHSYHDCDADLPGVVIDVGYKDKDIEEFEEKSLDKAIEMVNPKWLEIEERLKREAEAISKDGIEVSIEDASGDYYDLWVRVKISHNKITEIFVYDILIEEGFADDVYFYYLKPHSYIYVIPNAPSDMIWDLITAAQIDNDPGIETENTIKCDSDGCNVISVEKRKAG